MTTARDAIHPHQGLSDATAAGQAPSSQDQHDDAPDGQVSRRRMMRNAAVAGAVAAAGAGIAACGTGGSYGSGGSNPPAGSQPAGSAPAGSQSASGGGSVHGPSSDIPDGG